MNSNTQHCFLLDGKILLPIDYHHQLFGSLRKRHSLNKKLESMNNNKEDCCACSLKSTEKISPNRLEKFASAKRNTCKYRSSSDEQINQNEICSFKQDLVPRHPLPSINVAIDSSSNKNNQSPSAITIIIKPFMSSENHRKDTSFDKKSHWKKRKNSSSSFSLQTAPKRMATYFSDQAVNKAHLSTFKDLTRSIPVTINFHENSSSNLLHSRTLLNIYRSRKQY